MSAITSPTSTVDYSRKWLVMIAVVAGVILATIDGSIVNVAMPTLVESLDTSFSVIQWVSLAYLLTIATLTLGMGRLGDVIGKRTLYAIGFGVFTVASALCGLAPSVEWLIAFRVVQALGSVLVLALGSAILVEAFPPNERGKALGWVGTAVSLGIITGPVVGGLIISGFGWRPIFLVNIPVGIVGTWLAIRYVPKKGPVPGQSFDVPGTILMSTALFSLSLSLTLGQDMGYGSTPILIGFAVAAIAAVAFVVAELRAESPMLQLRLFRNPVLTVSVASGYLAFVCLSATFLLMPFYMQGVLGYEVGFIGLLLGAAPLAMGVVSPLSGSLSDKVGIRRLTLIGLMLIAAAYLVLLTFDTQTTPLGYLLHALPLGIGVGLFQSPNNSAIMGSVPPEYMGVGGGLLTITRLFGSISGVALLGSIWAASVASAAGGELPPGGASTADPIAQVSGLHTTFTVAAVIMAVALVIGVWGFRNERLTRAAAGSEPFPAEA
ncbi:MAG: MFS transporter [Acidimicrobiia bacterium]